MKRKLKWIGVVLVVLLLGFGTALFLWPRDRITAESWKQIRIGMTEKEVEAILGGPGLSEVEYHDHIRTLEKELGKFPFGVGGEFFVEPDDAVHVAGQDLSIWIGQHGRIKIGFDPQGHATWKTYEGLRPTDPSVIDRLRDWLGW
jgi:hypothetical protein